MWQRRSLLTLAGTVVFAARSAPARAQAASAAETAHQRGRLLAGVKADTPPFGFVDSNNHLAGFDIDTVREVGKSMGLPVELVKVTSVTRIPLLLSGAVDLVAASMTHTREREKAIDFSITYYVGAQSLLVPQASPIHELKDLAGKRVAVQQGTTLQKTLESVAPDAQQMAFRDYTSAWLALREGRADAFTGSSDILRGFAKSDNGFRLTGGKFSVEPFGIGMRHGDWALRDIVNASLQDAWRSGQYSEMYKRWFGIEPEQPIEEWPKA